MIDEAGRRRRAQRQPHHPAAATANGDGMADQKHVFLRTCSRRSALLWSATTCTSRMPMRSSFPVYDGGHADHGRRHPGRRPARRDQPPLDQEHHRQPRRQQALLDRRLNRTSPKPAWRSRKAGRDLGGGPEGRQQRLFATGLRNPNGLGWQPKRRRRCGRSSTSATSSQRPRAGLLTSVRKARFYGWPYSYWGQTVDARVEPPKPDLFAKR